MKKNIKKLSLRLVCISSLILYNTAFASIQSDLNKGLSASQAMQNSINTCHSNACVEQVIKEMLSAGIPLTTVVSAAASNGRSIKMITSAALSSGEKIEEITIAALNVPGISDRLALEQVISINNAIGGDNVVIFKTANDAGVAQITISQAAKNAGMSDEAIIAAALQAGWNTNAVLAGIQVAKSGNVTAAGGSISSQNSRTFNSAQPRNSTFGEKSMIVNPLGEENLQPSVPNNIQPKNPISPN